MVRMFSLPHLQEASIRVSAAASNILMGVGESFREATTIAARRSKKQFY